jgi:DmsE family decaheme c-type cytochrome
MRLHAIGGVLLALLLGLPARAAVQTAEKPPEQTTPPVVQPAVPVAPQPAAAPAEAAASPACSDCHAEQAKSFAANAHARGQVKKGEVPNALCSTCHGDGTAHIEAGGDKSLIYKPAGLAGSEKTCMSCHDVSTERLSRHAGMHANSDLVNCLTCHSIHSPEPRSPHLLAGKQLVLCDSCHATQVSSFRNKPYAHRLGRGGMECSSCHEPHGRPGAGSLRTTAAGEPPCLSCHADKRGPFVFQHGALAGGSCMSCHEAHGSSNPKRLTRGTVAQLCLECHSPTTGTTLGSQPPSFHNLTSPRYQNCTTCHVAIHGSNRDPQLLK